MDETDKLGVTAAEILFAIICSGTCESITRRTISASSQLLRLPGPATLRTLDTILNPGEQV